MLTARSESRIEGGADSLGAVIEGPIAGVSDWSALPDVFVSYSRRDGEFVRALAADLESRGKSVWIDTQGIGDGEVFPDAIRRAIEQSDAFVFVISPESIASRYCKTEVDYAQQLQKRLVPVLRELVEDDGLPEAIRVRNWIPYTPDVDASAAAARLVAALDTDLDHTRAHTRWLVKALEWDSHNRDASFLLRGSELGEGEVWLAGVGDHTEPAPTALQREYLYASRAASSRRQRWLVGASMAVAAVSVGLVIFALLSRSQAQSARNRAVFAQSNAQSRALAAESATQLSIDPERSVLLAMAAVRAQPTPEATYALRRAIDLSPIRGRLPNVGVQPNGVGWGPGIAYSPDRKQIAEGSQNGTLQLLDAHTLRVERRIRVGSFAPQLAYAPSGSLLAVGTNHGVVLLDPTTGASRGTIKPMTNAGSLQFSPDGSLLAVNELDPSTYVSHLEVWNLRTHRLRVVPVGPTLSRFGLSSVGFSPDGRRLVVGSFSGVGVFDTRTWRLRSTALGNRQVQAAEYSPDGSLIAVAVDPDSTGASGNQTAQLLDASTLKPRATLFTSASSEVWMARFSPDGTRVAFNSSDTFGVYSIKTHSLVFKSGLGVGLSEIAFSPDGRQLAVTSSDGNGAVYRATGTEREEIDPGGINPNGGVRLALTGAQVVAAFSPTGGANAGRLTVQTWSWSGRPTSRPLVISQNTLPYVGIDPQGMLAFVAPAVYTLGNPVVPTPVRIWDLNQRRVTTTLTATGSAGGGGVFNADGSRIVEQVLVDRGGDTGIELLDVTSGHAILLGKSACNTYITHAVSDSGKVVVAVDACGHMTTWRITSNGPTAQRLPGSLAQTVGPIRFSPDGKHVAIANPTGNGDVRIINPTTGLSTTTLTGHTNAIYGIAYSPDGKLLATASIDGTAKIWNPQTGQLLRTLDHPNPVYRVAFSPDGRTLATMDSKGIIRLFDACTDCQNPTALIALANTRVTRHLTPANSKPTSTKHRPNRGGEGVGRAS